MKLAPFVGAFVGACVGAAVWYWLAASSPPRESTWVPVLMGFLSGLGAKLLAEPIVHNRRRGAAVAAIALVMMLAAQQGIAIALAKQFDGSPVSNEFSKFSAAEPSTESEESIDATSGVGTENSEGTETTDVESVAPAAVELVDGMPMRPTTIEDYRAAAPPEPVDQQMFLLLSFAVGMFLAYALGKDPRQSSWKSNPDAPSRASGGFA